MDWAIFYNKVRHSDLLGPVLSSDEFEGIEAIVKAATCRDDVGAARLAYMLATAYHETAGTMQPVREYGSNAYLTNAYDVKGRNPSRAIKYGNTKPGDGIKYCGRGMVQLTWKNNYARAAEQLKIDLVNNPDLAMQLGIAAQIMVEGMFEGWFTGLTLKFLPVDKNATLSQFMTARKIINGTDRAERIANYALKFQTYLNEAGMK
jgi:predicted chitinase